MANPAALVLQGYSEPTEDERENYFRGLAGTPRLIARTSTAPWTKQDSWDPKTSRAISTIGSDHEIVRKWCPELRTSIISVLNESGIDWDTFYPIRTGTDSDCFYPVRTGSDSSRRRTYPVVLLVGLRPGGGDCTWEVAMRAALRCHDLLKLYGISDVNVEINESQFHPLASSTAKALAVTIDWSYSQPIFSGLRDMELADVNDSAMTLLPFAGSHIEQEAATRPGESKARSGTLGLYLRLRKAGPETDSQPISSSDPIYGLTSRHVAIGDRVAFDKDFCRHLSSSSSLPSPKNDKPQIRMLAGNYSCVDDALDILETASYNVDHAKNKTQHVFFRDPTIEYFAELYKLQNACLRYVVDLKGELHKVRDAMGDSLQQFAGTVALSPRHEIGQYGHFKDWALIRMNDEDTAQTSKVYMTGGRNRSAIGNVKGSRLQWHKWENIQLDTDGFVRLHARGLPPKPSFASGVRTSSIVAKRGQKSGLQFGITNEIEAVRRVSFAAEDHTENSLVAIHLLVLGFKGQPFSEPGDSGACVFDDSGQVVGILDGGNQVGDVKRYMKKYRVGSSAVDLPDASPVPDQANLPDRFEMLESSGKYEAVPAKKQAAESTKEEGAPEKAQGNGLAVAVDVTYVTPIQWVFDDIREFTGCEPEIVCSVPKVPKGTPGAGSTEPTYVIDTTKTRTTFGIEFTPIEDTGKDSVRQIATLL